MFAWESVLVVAVQSDLSNQAPPHGDQSNKARARAILTPGSVKIHSDRSRGSALYGICRGTSLSVERPRATAAPLFWWCSCKFTVPRHTASRGEGIRPGPEAVSRRTRVARTAGYGPVLDADDAEGCTSPRMGCPKPKSRTAMDQGASTWRTVASLVGSVGLAWNCEAPAVNE